MKGLICIAHYGTGQTRYLYQVLDSYERMSIDFDVAIYLTDDVDISRYQKLKFKKLFFDRGIKTLLPHQHKKYMAEKVDNYDLFIYTEDDMLIEESHIQRFLDLSRKLEGTNYVPGFIRYEKKTGDDYTYLIDMHSGNCTLRYGKWWMRFYALKHHIIKNKIIEYKVVIDGETFFEPNNLHQACYLLTREQFRHVLVSGNYFLGPDGGFGATLESAASDVYFRCGLVKLICEPRIEELLIHHLPDKYVNNYPQYDKQEVPNVEKLRQLVRKAKERRLTNNQPLKK